MAIPRASVNLLRTGIRPAVGTAPLRPLQVRLQSQVSSDGDIGGPGGQQPPPPNPGGPEAIKRNWIPITLAAGLALGAGWYVSNPRPGKGRPERTPEGDLRAASSTEIGHMPPPSGRSIAKALEDKESQALSEMSGRKRDGMGGFRAE